MDCKEARDILVECLTGTTPPDRRRALEAHLESCAACRGQAQELEESARLLRAVSEPRIPEGYWATFMAALDRRVAQEAQGWRRFVRWVRSPRLAWSTAAAASAAVVALGIAVLLRPAGQLSTVPPDPNAHIRGFVTEAIVQSMPSMSAALDLWKAGLTASEVPYEIPAGGE